MKFLIFSALFAFSTSHASPLRVTGLSEGWKYQTIPVDSPVSAFTDGAHGVLSFGQSETGPLASVLVHEIAIPDKLTLGKDPAAWKKAIFEAKALSKNILPAGRTVNVKGQWRYLIEFQSDGNSMLNTAILATVVDGKIHMSTYE